MGDLRLALILEAGIQSFEQGLNRAITSLNGFQTRVNENLGKAQKSFDKLNGSVEDQARNFVANLINAEVEVKKFADKVGISTQQAAAFFADLAKREKEALQAAEREAEKVKQKLKEFGDMVQSASQKAQFAFAGMVAGIGVMVHQASKAHDAMRVLDNAAKLAGVGLDQARKIAADTAQSLGLTSDSAGRLTASVIEMTKRAGDTSKTAELMQALGDAAAGAGIDFADLDEIVRQTLTGQDEGLNKLRLANPQQIYEQWAKAAGTSAAKMTDAEKAQAIVNAIINKGKENAGQAAERMKGYAGALAGAKQAADEAARALGEAFLPTVTQLLKDVTAISKPMAEWVKANPELAKGMGMVALGITGLVAGLGPMITAVNNVKIAWEGLGVVFKTIQTTSLFGLIGPAGLISAATAGIVALGGAALTAGIAIGNALRHKFEPTLQTGAEAEKEIKHMEKIAAARRKVVESIREQQNQQRIQEEQAAQKIRENQAKALEALEKNVGLEWDILNNRLHNYQNYQDRLDQLNDYEQNKLLPWKKLLDLSNLENQKKVTQAERELYNARQQIYKEYANDVKQRFEEIRKLRFATVEGGKEEKRKQLGILESLFGQFDKNYFQQAQGEVKKALQDYRQQLVTELTSLRRAVDLEVRKEQAEGLRGILQFRLKDLLEDFDRFKLPLREQIKKLQAFIHQNWAAIRRDEQNRQQGLVSGEAIGSQVGKLKVTLDKELKAAGLTFQKWTQQNQQTFQEMVTVLGMDSEKLFDLWLNHQDVFDSLAKKAQETSQTAGKALLEVVSEERDLSAAMAQAFAEYDAALAAHNAATTAAERERTGEHLAQVAERLNRELEAIERLGRTEDQAGEARTRAARARALIRADAEKQGETIATEALKTEQQRREEEIRAHYDKQIIMVRMAEDAKRITAEQATAAIKKLLEEMNQKIKESSDKAVTDWSEAMVTIASNLRSILGGGLADFVGQLKNAMDKANALFDPKTGEKGGLFGVLVSASAFAGALGPIFSTAAGFIGEVFGGLFGGVQARIDDATRFMVDRFNQVRELFNQAMEEIRALEMSATEHAIFEAARKRQEDIEKGLAPEVAERRFQARMKQIREQVDRDIQTRALEMARKARDEQLKGLEQNREFIRVMGERRVQGLRERLAGELKGFDKDQEKARQQEEASLDKRIAERKRTIEKEHAPGIEKAQLALRRGEEDVRYRIEREFRDRLDKAREAQDEDATRRITREMEDAIAAALETDTGVAGLRSILETKQSQLALALESDKKLQELEEAKRGLRDKYEDARVAKESEIASTIGLTKAEQDLAEALRQNEEMIKQLQDATLIASPYLSAAEKEVLGGRTFAEISAGATATGTEAGHTAYVEDIKSRAKAQLDSLMAKEITWIGQAGGLLSLAHAAATGRHIPDLGRPEREWDRGRLYGAIRALGIPVSTDKGIIENINAIIQAILQKGGLPTYHTGISFVPPAPSWLKTLFGLGPMETIGKLEVGEKIIPSLGPSLPAFPSPAATTAINIGGIKVDVWVQGNMFRNRGDMDYLVHKIENADYLSARKIKHQLSGILP